MIDEELRCKREEDNPRYPYAVAVTKSCTVVVGVEVVGHIPRLELSKTSATSLLASSIKFLPISCPNGPQGSGNFWPRGASFLRKYSRSAITQN